MADDKDPDDRGSALPRSALARTARLAALPVGFAGRTTLGVGKRLAGRPGEIVLAEVQARTADQIFKVLGELKGGAMKFGQAMSVFESVLPDELAGPYRETLTRLQDAAPPMSPAMVTRVLVQELGADWTDKLPVFDPIPAAAASIGQVHRGTWIDGREVAVKLQYPGAAKALQSDLRQIGRVARLFGVIAPGLEVKPLVEELQARVVEELDYDLEAAAQHAFAAEFAGDDEIVVPDVVTHTERALVTEWMESPSSLARIITTGSQEERNTYGERYVRFLFAGPTRTGMLHADPHPGNFRILPDGRLGVVDFGAVARFPEGLPPILGTLLRHAVDGDFDAVTDGLRAEGFIKPGTKLHPDTIRQYLDPFVEPARQETFAFTRAWMREQTTRVASPGSEGLGTAIKINLPREYLLIHRVWLGGIGVLSQLGAVAPFRSILEESLPGFKKP